RDWSSDVCSSDLPGPNQDGVITLCTNPGVFDFSTLSAGIVNGNPNFTVTYHNNTNDLLTNSNPLGTVTVNTANTYYYALHYTDPTNPRSEEHTSELQSRE